MINNRYLLPFYNMLSARLLFSYHGDSCFSCLFPQLWEDESDCVTGRMKPRGKSSQKKDQKKSQMLTSHHLLKSGFSMSILLKFYFDLSPSPGCQNVEEESCWLTHETHYQKLSILTVKAMEAICTLLRSLLHFDNCFSPWTVEF